MIAVDYCVVRGGTGIQDRRPPTSGNQNEVNLIAGATVIGFPNIRKMACLQKVLLARMRLFMVVKPTR